jgi:malate dehydrogenase
MNRKLAIIGSGNIGGLLAQIASSFFEGEIVLLDVNKDMAKGKALDLEHSATLYNKDVHIYGTDDYKDIKDANIVVVTAGKARKDGMTRADLLTENAKIIQSIANGVKKYAEDAFVIIVTNPLDAMVTFFQRCTNFAKERVVGMAGELDNARFRSFLAKEVKVKSSEVESMVIGEHGSNMLPLVNRVKIKGAKLTDLIKSGNISLENVENAVTRTRSAGAEIVGLLCNGSAFYAPAALLAQMVRSYVEDLKHIFCASVCLKGQYDVNGIYVGMPVVIGKRGVEKIVKFEPELNTEELEQFNKSVSSVAQLVGMLPDVQTD